MANFQIDPESKMQAEKLSSLLVDDLRNASRERSNFEFRDFARRVEPPHADMWEERIEDVLANINQMATVFALARRWDSKVLCMKLKDGGMAPIGFNGFWGGSGPAKGSLILDPIDFEPDFSYRRWRDVVRNFEEEGDDNIVLTAVSEAEERVQQSLTSFLAHRFASLKRFGKWMKMVGKIGFSFSSIIYKWRFRDVPPPRPGVSKEGGLRVRVSCRTPGLRLHVSPAYFINWVYFGSPTTPVESYVLPGRYVFAGDGPLLPRRRKDPTVFSIPADFYPNIVRF